MNISVIDIKNGNQPKYSYDKKIIGFLMVVYLILKKLENIKFKNINFNSN